MGKARLLGENVVTPQAPQNKVGKLTGITQSALQGLSLGSADELQGLVAGLYSKFTEGKDFQTAYNETVDAIRSDLASFREQEPVLAFGSEIAGSLPTAMFGGARLAKAGVDAVKSAGLMGGAYGGFATDSSDPVDIALGTGTGALAGGTLQKVAPYATEGAKELIKRGVPVTVGDAVGGGLKRLEEAMTSVPLLGSSIASAKQRSKIGFDRTIFEKVLEPLREFGVNPKKIVKGKSGNELYDAVEKVVTKAYDDVVPTLKLPKRQSVQSKIDDAIYNSAETLDDNLEKVFFKDLEKIIYSKFDADGNITGEGFKQAVSQLRTKARKIGASQPTLFSDDLIGSYKNVENVLIDILKTTNPSQKVKLDAIDKSFKRLLPVERSVIQSEGGEFTADQVLRNIKKADTSLRNKDFARGKADMQPLVRAGQETIKQRLPNSGTADRVLANIAVGGGLVFDPLTVGIGSALTVPAYSRVGVPLVRDFTTRGIAPVIGRGAPFYGGLLGQNVQDANFFGMNRR
tara:strand:- start:452 stop:2002 length:1551 start_codon:yes stop_codon:yes gene_type:complete